MKTILLILIGLSSILSAEFSRDDAHGIVTDSTTGLLWQDDAVGITMTWQNAIDHCETLSLGGYEDWRLPNVNELTSLVDDTSTNPSISSIFQLTASDSYWSSTTYAGDSSYAWVVDFNYGSQYDYHGKNYFNYVRCVRAGQ